MGVLTPGSAHARPSAHPPIDTSARVCRVNLQIFQRGCGVKKNITRIFRFLLENNEKCLEFSDLAGKLGGRAEGLVCADPGARTPIGVSGNSRIFHILGRCKTTFTMALLLVKTHITPSIITVRTSFQPKYNKYNKSTLFQSKTRSAKIIDIDNAKHSCRLSRGL